MNSAPDDLPKRNAPVIAERNATLGLIKRNAPLILAASPRDGNSLLAASEFCRGLDAVQSQSIAEKPACSNMPVQLRHYRILPCVDCGACGRKAASITPAEFLKDPASLCPLSEQDDSRPLLNALASAMLIALCSPIYFYHLPAQLKALLDRCQLFYMAAQSATLGPLLRKRPPRPLFSILLGARTKGDKLFEGSLLSLKYALAPLGLVPQTPLLLYGLDQASDLSADRQALAGIYAYAEQARASVRAYGGQAAQIPEPDGTVSQP